MDPYKVLGVSRTASSHDIDLAYRSLLARRQGDGASSGDMPSAEAINEAYSLLDDPDWRRHFDAETREPLVSRLRRRWSLMKAVSRKELHPFPPDFDWSFWIEKAKGVAAVCAILLFGAISFWPGSLSRTATHRLGTRSQAQTDARRSVVHELSRKTKWPGFDINRGVPPGVRDGSVVHRKLLPEARRVTAGAGSSEAHRRLPPTEKPHVPFPVVIKSYPDGTTMRITNYALRTIHTFSPTGKLLEVRTLGGKPNTPFEGVIRAEIFGEHIVKTWVPGDPSRTYSTSGDLLTDLDGRIERMYWPNGNPRTEILYEGSPGTPLITFKVFKTYDPSGTLRLDWNWASPHTQVNRDDGGLKREASLSKDGIFREREYRQNRLVSELAYNAETQEFVQTSFYESGQPQRACIQKWRGETMRCEVYGAKREILKSDTHYVSVRPDDPVYYYRDVWEQFPRN